MTPEECIALLGEWDGYELVSVVRETLDDGTEQVVLDLQPDGSMGVCSHCGQLVADVHDYTARYVRDLPILDAQTLLVVHRRRVRCPDCGPRLEALSWLELHARVTKRLSESVARLCRVLTIKHVADHFGLDWHQVKQIDKRYLARTLMPVDLRGVRLIAMDEFSLRKGYKYATVIACAITRRVLYVAEGRGRASVRPFFEMLGPDGCAKLQACATDLNAPYHVELAKHAPQAEVVCDLFHVLQNYARYVVDRVRVDIANQLRDDKAARRIVKGSRWLLLRNRDNLNESQEVKLTELLAANADLMTVYVLREDLRAIWTYRRKHQARAAFMSWWRRAHESGIAALITFADKLATHLDTIVAHCRYPIGTSFLEGMNNKIKVLKRMAYGYRDTAYFFLKIHAAFPGVTR